MSHPKLMLVKNVAWASEVTARDADFFTRMAQGQSPDVLWIGCSDSRVPAESITNSAPGELFVHRNIANLVSANDENAMSVIEYAVEVLKVKHIVVCGHYQCGGIRAALMPQAPTLPTVNKRIMQLRALAAKHKRELDELPSLNEQVDRLAELNVLQQVITISDMPVIREMKSLLTLQGWIFGLHDGLIKVLSCIDRLHDAPTVTQPFKDIVSV
jgi:carbonic anhydrase